MPFADVGEVELFFTDEGSGGQPIVFLHGLGCDSHDWSWQLSHFALHHRVIAMDLRGHGRSSAPAGGYSPRSLAGDVAALLDRLGCRGIVVVGHSLGAVVANVLAVERPEIVQAVVSVTPGHLVPEEARAITDGIVASMTTDDPVAVTQALFQMSYTPSSPAPLQTWHLRRAAGMSPHVLQKAHAGLFHGPEALAIGATSEALILRRDCPALVFYSDEDRAGLEQRLLDGRKDARVVVWAGAGHWLHQERPVEFNHTVSDWLADLNL